MASREEGFRSIPHILHELFLFANGYGYLDEYGFEVGEYMPRSHKIMGAISQQVEYNFLTDNYIVKREFVDYRKFAKFREEVGSDRIDDIVKVRAKCEIFAPKELAVILHETEKDYILKREFNKEERTKIRAILLLTQNDWLDRGDAISKTRFQQIEEYFNVKGLTLFSEFQKGTPLLN